MQVPFCGEVRVDMFEDSGWVRVVDRREWAGSVLVKRVARVELIHKGVVPTGCSVQSVFGRQGDQDGGEYRGVWFRVGPIGWGCALLCGGGCTLLYGGRGVGCIAVCGVILDGGQDQLRDWEHVDVSRGDVGRGREAALVSGGRRGGRRAFFDEVGDWEGGGVSPWSEDWYATIG